MLSILIGIAVFIYFAPGNPAQITTDSLEYKEFAELLLTGEALSPVRPDERRLGLVTRTPGYPILLLCSRFLSAEFPVAVTKLHTILGVLTLLALPLLLRTLVHPAVSTCAILYSFYLMRILMPAVYDSRCIPGT